MMKGALPDGSWLHTHERLMRDDETMLQVCNYHRYFSLYKIENSGKKIASSLSRFFFFFLARSSNRQSPRISEIGRRRRKES